jgi:hypothetical protein
MASGDFNKKIQGIAKDLCFDPNAPMGPQLQNLSDGIRQVAFTIANELDPINTPTPPNLDLPPLDWQMPDLPDGFDGGMPSDGGWGGDGGDLGGGEGDGGWGQDGKDGIGGEPGNDGIEGNDGQDGLDAPAGRGCVHPAFTKGGATGMSDVGPGSGEAELLHFNHDAEDPEEQPEGVVTFYNISSQEVGEEKYILLGTDHNGKHWVLVESCDEDEDE